MIKQIRLNGRAVQYNLERKNVKNLNLRIKPNRSVYVSANNHITDSVIEQFLQSKADYILKALDYYEELQKYAPKPKLYVDGESFRILGHELRLKVSVESKNQVLSDGAFVHLHVKDMNDYDLKKQTMDKWIKRQCQITLEEICTSVYPKFKKYGINFPALRFRNMVSRWGSCQPKREILTFNIALIEAPLSCIEYVVVHEFTHFLQPNHSEKFYQTLAMFMPDWKERKRLLEKTFPYQL